MGTRRRASPLTLAALVAFVVATGSVCAQDLPSEPIVMGGGRVVVSGDASLTASCAHAEQGAACGPDTGFFNYSDYDASTLRMVRLGVAASVRISGRLTALGEIRMENDHAPRANGAYLRVRPFERYEFDIQAGRIPPTFGAFTRHAYSTDNLLIGYPLAYQYLLSLRDDALPATDAELVRMRGRGWLSSFSLGNQQADAGLPIADAFRWDTGVQAHGAVGWFEAAASVTNGALTRPVVRDDNTGKQVAARVAARPVTGLVLGASVSSAPFVESAAAAAAHVDATDVRQRAFGVDAEFSRDHYLLRFESVASRYALPTLPVNLHALATMVEGRYKITPRTHVAARLDHLGFSRIAGPTGPTPWEAPVTRIEFGSGYALQRNLQLRLGVQHNSRNGGRVRRLTAVAAQLLYWF